MSQYGERNSHEDAWWRELYGEEKPDAGPAAADDSLDDRFDSASRAVGSPPAHPGPARERPGGDRPAGEDPGPGWFAAPGFPHGDPQAPEGGGGTPPGAGEEGGTGPVAVGNTGTPGTSTGHGAGGTGHWAGTGTGSADRGGASSGGDDAPSDRGTETDPGLDAGADADADGGAGARAGAGAGAGAGDSAPAPAGIAAPEQWEEPPRRQDPHPDRESGGAGSGGPWDTAAASPPSAESAPDEWWFSTPATSWPVTGPQVSGDSAGPPPGTSSPPPSPPPPSAPGPGAPWQAPGPVTEAALPAPAPAPRDTRPLRSMTPPRAPWEPPLDPSESWDGEEAAPCDQVWDRQRDGTSPTPPYEQTGRPPQRPEGGPESRPDGGPDIGPDIGSDGGSGGAGGEAPEAHRAAVPPWRTDPSARNPRNTEGQDTETQDTETQDTESQDTETGNMQSTWAGAPAEPGPDRDGTAARTDGGHVAVGTLRRDGDEAAGDGGRHGGAAGPGSTGPAGTGPGTGPGSTGGAGTGGGPRAGVEPGYVGERPPTYQGEPTALPEADPGDLDGLVPDTVLDGARYGTMTLRAASLRGDSARYRGEPRRDALLTARFGSGDRALLLIATATGGRAAGDAHRAAADVCRWVAEAVGRAHGRLAEDIREERRGALKSGLHRLTDRSYGKLRARAAELGLRPAAYTSGLRCLLLPVDPACRTRVFFGIGGGGLFRLRDGEWQDLEPWVPGQPQTADGAPAGSCTTLPGQGGAARGASALAGTEAAAVSGPAGSAGPAGPVDGREFDGPDRAPVPAVDRLTVDLGTRGPGRSGEAGGPALAPFRFRASVARPGDTLLLCTAGLADPLRGEPALAGLLAARWAVSPAPGLAAYLSDVQLRVKGYADDRTAAAVWED